MTLLHRITILTAFAAVLPAAHAMAQGDKPATPAAQTAPKRPPKPGSDRWLIKTASDAEAQEISSTPSLSTVEKLLAIPRPLDMPLDGSNPFFQQHRARPAETTVYTVEADIVDCRLMPDGDYKVTVRGASGKTMVLEMPSPDPAFVDPKSKFAAQVKAGREQFGSKFKPDTTAQPVSGHARITGVGFFGRTFGGRKAEGNLIQLHPVLNIEWLEKPTADFMSTPPPAPATGAPGPRPADRRPTPAQTAKKPVSPKKAR